MNNRYIKSITASYFDFDAQMNLKPSAVLNYLQEAGGGHANLLKVGKDHLLEKGLFFALTKIKCEFVSKITPGEQLLIHTTPCISGKMILGRDFIIYNEKGECVIKSSSKWGLVDLETRRAVPVSRIDFKVEPAFSAEVDIEAIIPQNCQKTYTYLPGYSDLDFNGHVNNARYADAILNALGRDKLTSKNIKSFQINYNKESRDGESIDFYLSFQDNGYVLEGKCSDERRICAKVVLCNTN